MSDQINFQALQGWYEQVLTAAKPHLTPENIKSLAAKATKTALDFAKEHPYRASFMVVSAGLTPILGSGWMAAPFLKLIGFTPLGPAAGKAYIILSNRAF